jgi:hypothetical protein
MRGFISTSRLAACIPAVTLAALLLLALAAAPAFAQAPGQPAGPGAGEKKDKTLAPEEEDFTGSPFTEYGEFNEEEEEESDARFFAYGRFFGVSLGLGFESVDGNRGLLWQGGFPVVDFKVHYWFDFNVAIDIGFFTASHFYQTTDANGGHIDVSIFHVGMDVKYYFDTKNLAAAVSFANPYVSVGVGDFNKTETSFTSGNPPDQDNALGLSVGGGVEFAIKPRKTYFEVEAKVHIVQYKDTFTTLFQNSGIPDLTGNFYTFTGNLLFTW